MKDLEWQCLGALRTCGPCHFSEVISRLRKYPTQRDHSELATAMQRLMNAGLAWANEKECDLTSLGRIAFKGEAKRRADKKAMETLKRRRQLWGAS